MLMVRPRILRPAASFQRKSSNANCIGNAPKDIGTEPYPKTILLFCLFFTKGNKLNRQGATQSARGEEEQ